MDFPNAKFSETSSQLVISLHPAKKNRIYVLELFSRKGPNITLFLGDRAITSPEMIENSSER